MSRNRGDEMTRIVEKSDISLLVDALAKGEIVSFPTETVYGLACRFNDQQALDRLMAAKNRDYSKAITLMLSHKEMISEFAEVNPSIQNVIEAFMPGSITIILRKKDCVGQAMTNGRDTIGIRIPDDDFVLKLIDLTGPLLVTSANLSGQPNTTNEKEVLKQLDGCLSYVVRGQTQSALASTVVDLTGTAPKILREGLIKAKNIEEVFHEDCNRM